MNKVENMEGLDSPQKSLFSLISDFEKMVKANIFEDLDFEKKQICQIDYANYRFNHIKKGIAILLLSIVVYILYLYTAAGANVIYSLMLGFVFMGYNSARNASIKEYVEVEMRLGQNINLKDKRESKFFHDIYQRLYQPDLKSVAISLLLLSVYFVFTKFGATNLIENGTLAAEKSKMLEHFLAGMFLFTSNMFFIQKEI